MKVVDVVAAIIEETHYKNSRILIAWRVTAYSGIIQLRCHSHFLWLSPEEVENYPLAPADIPLLQAYRKSLQPQ